MRRPVIIASIVDRLQTGTACHVINHDQSARSIHPLPLATRPAHKKTERARSCRSFLLRATKSTSGLATMTSSREIGAESDNGLKNCCESEELYVGNSSPTSANGCADFHLQNSAAHLTLSHRLLTMSRHPTVHSSSNSLPCTPHSIDDILSRPRPNHVTSILLPYSSSRRTSGPAPTHQVRLCSWSSEAVQRLTQRTADGRLTWNSLHWSQRVPESSHTQITATAPSKRGS